jgi:hypothetical protein
MIRIFTRQIERLGSEEGQALVFVALVGLVIFLFFSMAMNVAELVNVKIKNQNVADAAALSAAVWQARALNLIAASNRIMLELWVVALATGYGCVFSMGLCAAFFCLEMAVDPLPCLLCLIGPALACPAAYSGLAGAASTGVFEDSILDRIDMSVVEADLPEVVDLNYAFKPNTARLEAPEDIGVYMHYPLDGEDLLRAYVPPDAESGEYPLERVGICETLVMFARYANEVWHETDEAVGLTDDDWNLVASTISDWYRDPDGPCFEQTTLIPGVELAFPLALRTRTSDWAAQDVDSLLAVTVATYRVQEPPSSLGKGTDSADCTRAENDTRFACPNIRHYAFAAAQSYSESVSEFYNSQIASLASPYLIPYVPIVMDWEPRLMPVQGPAFQDLLNQISADGFAEDSNVILNNVLQLGGMDFFLY